MANCPICEHHLPDDFGLLECAQCGAALFVEFDGTVRRRDEGEAAGSENLNLNPTPVVPSLDLTGHISTPQTIEAYDQDEIQREESGRADLAAPPAEEVQGAIDLGSLSRSQFNLGVAAGPQEALSSAEDVGEIQQQPAPPVKVAPEPQADQFSVQDLADYGNSQGSAAREGAYLYDLTISGIDSADLKKAVKEVLTDPLFLWDSEVLMREATSGELRLVKIPAVKASLVIQRMSGLPVGIKWVQHGLFEA